MKIVDFKDVYNIYSQQSDNHSKAIMKGLDFQAKQSKLTGSNSMAILPVFEKNQQETLNTGLTALLNHSYEVGSSGVEEYTNIKNEEMFPLANQLIGHMENLIGISRNHPDYAYVAKIITNCPTSNFHADETYYTVVMPLGAQTLTTTPQDSAKFISMFKKKVPNLSVYQANEWLKNEKFRGALSRKVINLPEGGALFFKGGMQIDDRDRILDSSALLHASPVCNNEGTAIEDKRKVLSITLVDRRFKDLVIK